MPNVHIHRAVQLALCIMPKVWDVRLTVCYTQLHNWHCAQCQKCETCGRPFVIPDCIIGIVHNAKSVKPAGDCLLYWDAILAYLLISRWWSDHYLMIIRSLSDDHIFIMWLSCAEYLLTILLQFNDSLKIICWLFIHYLMTNLMNIRLSSDNHLKIISWFSNNIRFNLMIIWWSSNDHLMIMQWTYDDDLIVIWWSSDNYLMIRCWISDDHLTIICSFSHYCMLKTCWWSVH